MAPPNHVPAATDRPDAECAPRRCVTTGHFRASDIAPPHHEEERRVCSSCGAAFCIACEGSNHGEPCFCERCAHVYLPHLEAA